jgi:hypothetical protein
MTVNGKMSGPERLKAVDVVVRERVSTSDGRYT